MRQSVVYALQRYSQCKLLVIVPDFAAKGRCAIKPLLEMMFFCIRATLEYKKTFSIPRLMNFQKTTR